MLFRSSPADYRTFILPHMRTLIQSITPGTPVIHFGTETAGLLELMAEAGGDVIGVDWRIEMDAARRRLGEDVALQGNLDPVALLAPWASLKPRAQHVLDQMSGRAGYIFNLGHGVLPQTPVENVARLVEFVRQQPHSQGEGLTAREDHPDAIRSATTRASLPGSHREAG